MPPRDLVRSSPRGRSGEPHHINYIPANTNKISMNFMDLESHSRAFISEGHLRSTPPRRKPLLCSPRRMTKGAEDNDNTRADAQGGGRGKEARGVWNGKATKSNHLAKIRASADQDAARRRVIGRPGAEDPGQDRAGTTLVGERDQV